MLFYSIFHEEYLVIQSTAAYRLLKQYLLVTYKYLPNLGNIYMTCEPEFEG